MRTLFLGWSLATFSICPVAALADKEVVRASEVRVDPAEFEAYRAWLIEELHAGRGLIELSPAGRSEVHAILERMERRLARVDRIEDLAGDDRRELFNDQERLRVILSEAEEDSRVHCRKEKVTGSHRPKSICQTVAEWRRHREDAHDLWRRHSMGPKLARERRNTWLPTEGGTIFP